MIKVSQQAVIARLRRKLAKDGQSLRHIDDSIHGPLCVVDDQSNCIVSSGHGIVDLAPEVLKSWEEMAA